MAFYHKKEYVTDKGKSAEYRVFQGPYLTAQQGARTARGPVYSDDQIEMWEQMSYKLKEDTFDLDHNQDLKIGEAKIDFNKTAHANAAYLSLTLPGIPPLRDLYLKLSPSRPKQGQYNRIASSSLVMQIASRLTDHIKYLNEHKNPPELDLKKDQEIYKLSCQGFPWLEEAVRLQNQTKPEEQPITTTSTTIGLLKARISNSGLYGPKMQLVGSGGSTPKQNDEYEMVVDDIQESARKKLKGNDSGAKIAPFNAGNELLPAVKEFLLRNELGEDQTVFGACYINWDIQKPLRTNPNQHKNYVCDGIEVCLMASTRDLILRYGNPYHLRVQHQSDCATTSYYLHHFPRKEYEELNKLILTFIGDICEGRTADWTHLDKSNRVIDLNTK